MNPVLQIPRRIIIHCSASKNGQVFPASKLHEMHVARGFDMIGYHLVVQPTGEVENGRPLNQVGAHVEGHNNGSIGICLIGNDKFTEKQFDALRYKIDSLILTYNIKAHDIYCHHQFDTAIKQGKTCPNIPINVILCWYHNVSKEPIIAPFLLREVS